MNDFKVNDRVKVKWPSWEGEGVVEEGPKTVGYGRPHPVYIVRLETGRMKGNQGGFEPTDLELIATKPQPGDRVEVTLVGTVEANKVSDKLRVRADGVTSNYGFNSFDLDAEGITVKVLEPEYAQGTVVKDAKGRFYKREFDHWLEFGSAGVVPFARPARPLTVVE